MINRVAKTVEISSLGLGKESKIFERKKVWPESSVKKKKTFDNFLIASAY